MESLFVSAMSDWRMPDKSRLMHWQRFWLQHLVVLQKMKYCILGAGGASHSPVEFRRVTMKDISYVLQELHIYRLLTCGRPKATQPS